MGEPPPDAGHEARTGEPPKVAGPLHHYCRHFAKRRSHLTLELSDGYRKRLGRRISVDIDGKVEKRVPAANQTITLPAGVGLHTVEIRPE
jgi:hypothetical protein